MRTRSTARAEHRVASQTSGGSFYRAHAPKRKRTSDSTEKEEAEQEGDDRAAKRQRYKERNMSAMTCSQLRKACTSNNWTGHWLHRKKSELLRFIETQLIRNDVALFDDTNRYVYRACQILNDDDPVTLEDLTSRSSCYVFTLNTPETNSKGAVRRVHRFCPISLVKYILIDGQALNPLTRTLMNDIELLELEHRYVSCIRSHSTAPSTVQALLRLRTDMKASRIAAAPSTVDLQLEAEELFPGPVMSFAPWIDSRTLADVARSRRTRILADREHERTANYMSDIVLDWLTALDDMMDSTMLDGMNDTTMQIQLLLVVLADIMRRMSVSLENLFDFDRHAAGRLCARLCTQISNRIVNTDLIFVEDVWSWVKATIGTTMNNNCTIADIETMNVTTSLRTVLRQLHQNTIHTLISHALRSLAGHWVTVQNAVTTSV